MKKSIILIAMIFLYQAAAYGAARYRGDLNGDDKVDMTDMVILAKALKAGASDSAYDINTSGSVDDNDLHALANIILSEKLTEDGFNVGIGGWGDDDTDYGGSVGAPRRSPAENTRFYMRNPRAEKSGGCSVEFGIESADADLCAALVWIEVPREVEPNESGLITLSGDMLDGHALYGNPVVKDESIWEDKRIGFIVLSPQLKPFKAKTGALGHIYYNISSYSDRDPHFAGCQAVAADSSVADNLDWHSPGNFEWLVTAPQYTLGDVNGDEKVNISDIVTLVSYISGTTPTIFIEEAADINQDNKINISDIVTLVNMISNQ